MSKQEKYFYVLMALWLAVIAGYGVAVENTFLLTLAGYTSALAIFALSINVMLGGVGEVPLGQSLFFGLGAYAVGIATQKWGMNYTTSIVVGVAFSAAVAVVLGSITLRLTGAYFSIVSWGIASVAVVCALNLEEITGGGMGLFGFGEMDLFGLDMSKPKQYFYATAGVLVLVVIGLQAVRNSRFGFAMESVRQNRHLAIAVGINPFTARLKAFILSAILASIAGSLSVPYIQIVTPESLGLMVTVDAMLMVLLGGSGALLGPVVGAVLFSIIPFYLNMDVNLRMLVFSLAIILIMMFMPGGLHQLMRLVLQKVKSGGRHART